MALRDALVVDPHRAVGIAADGVPGLLAQGADPRWAIGEEESETRRHPITEAQRTNLLWFRARREYGLALPGAGRGYAVRPNLGWHPPSASDPATFVPVAVVLATVGLASALVPAMRATRVDPQVALKAE